MTKTHAHALMNHILTTQTGFYPVILTGVWSLVQGWEQRVKAPEAPANYKDPAKIEEYCAKKRKTLYQDVLANCPSLWHIHALHLHVPFELSVELPEGLDLTGVLDCLFGPEALFGFDRIVVLGDNADKLLRAAYLRESEDYDHQRVATLVAARKIPTMTPESLLFTADERKMLLDTTPVHTSEEAEFQYIHSLLCRYFGKRFETMECYENAGRENIC